MKHSNLSTSLRALIVMALVMGGGSCAASAATAEDVIARVREFLGGDSALSSVKSIRFSGTILMPDGTGGDIEILVRRPMQQRITITTGKFREVTALSNYDGWRRVENLLDPADWELTLLDVRQIQRLRANTADNIGFFKGTGGVAPDLRLVAEEMIDGVPCVTVGLSYFRRIEFLRTFESETGRLIRTVTDTGSVLTEKGEIYVQGIRFPRELTTVTDAGKTTISFVRIQLNEPFPDDLFDVPMLKPGD